MAIAFESITPSAGDATDRFVVRRGAGPADHTMQLLTPASVKALLAITAADVSGFSEAVDDRVAALLVAGSNVTITYDDVANTLTIAAAGGGGSPGGSTTQVQYNNAGAFGGAPNVLIEGSELRLPAISTPTTPASGGVKLYSANVAAAWPLPAMIGSDGLPLNLQEHLGEFTFNYLVPQGNGTGLLQSFATTAIGAAGASNVATGNYHTIKRRVQFNGTAASATSIGGVRGAGDMFRIGRGANEPGGFYARMLWGNAIGNVSTSRAFCGFKPTAAETDVDPSTRLNQVGMGWDAADTQVRIMYNDGVGTSTKVALGVNFPKPTADRTEVYELQLYSPNSTTQSVSYRVIRYNTTGRTILAEATGTITTDIPAVTTFLSPLIVMSAGGTSTQSAPSVFGIYIATPY